MEKNNLLILLTACIATSTMLFGMETDNDDTPWAAKQTESIKPPAPQPADIILPTLSRPTGLSPEENEILDIFQQTLAPIASGLSTITESPEARQARELKLKEQEQKIQAAQKQRESKERGTSRWSPSSDYGSYHPSRRGGWDDFGGGRSSTLPRYWAPPSSGGDYDRDLGGHGLRSSDDEEDDDSDNDHAKSSSDTPKDDGTKIVGDKGKDQTDLYDKAIASMKSAADILEKISNEASTKKADDDFAQTILSNEEIGKATKKMSDAKDNYEQAQAALNDKRTNNPRIQEKIDKYNKEKSRLEATYTSLLPHLFRAAIIDAGDNKKEQKNIKKFLNNTIQKSAPESYAKELESAANHALAISQPPSTTRTPVTLSPANAAAALNRLNKIAKFSINNATLNTKIQTRIKQLTPPSAPAAPAHATSTPTTATTAPAPAPVGTP